MGRLQSVVWSKGTFLSPQHLQAQDHYMEDSLQFALRTNAFCAWGFLEVQVDAAALAEGQFQLAKGSGVFPDGLVFDLEDGDEAPASRTLREKKSFAKSGEVLYLAVPEMRRGGINIAPRAAGRTVRFSSEPRMLRDENSSGMEKPVSFARKNLQIVSDGDGLEGLVLLPVARVVRNAGGHFRLDEGFVPPMLNLKASARLDATLRGLGEVLVARSRELAGMRRQRGQTLAEFSASDIAQFWLLHTANTHIPALLGMLSRQHVHPEALWGEMLSLAGALSTFSREVQPSDLPRYEHERLGSCFRELERIVLRLLETVIPSRFVALPLTLLRDSIYATELEMEDERLRESRLYLAVAAELDTRELIARVPGLVKVGTKVGVDTLVRQALSGLALRHLPVQPSEIPVKLQFEYFSLERDGPAWEALLRARNLAVYVPGEIPGARLELILLPPAELSDSR